MGCGVPALALSLAVESFPLACFHVTEQPTTTPPFQPHRVPLPMPPAASTHVSVYPNVKFNTMSSTNDAYTTSSHVLVPGY